MARGYISFNDIIISDELKKNVTKVLISKISSIIYNLAMYCLDGQVCNDLNFVSHGLRTSNKSKESENLGQYGRQNMLRPYLKIWELELISSPGVRSPCCQP